MKLQLINIFNLEKKNLLIRLIVLKTKPLTQLLNNFKNKRINDKIINLINYFLKLKNFQFKFNNQ